MQVNCSWYRPAILKFFRCFFDLVLLAANNFQGRINLVGSTMTNGDLGVSLLLQFSDQGTFNWVRQWKTKSESIANSVVVDSTDKILRASVKGLFSRKGTIFS
jgi:hypothetical protein